MTPISYLKELYEKFYFITVHLLTGFHLMHLGRYELELLFINLVYTLTQMVVIAEVVSVGKSWSTVLVVE